MTATDLQREDCIKKTILDFEGAKFEDNPKDPGGATKYGVTAKTYSRWKKRQVTRDEVRTMTMSEAVEIYTIFFWREAKIDQYPYELRHVMFDMGVNMGTVTAVGILQKALRRIGVPVSLDNVLGPQTLFAVNACANTNKVIQLVNAICDERVEHYVEIASNNPSLQIFLKGWKWRANTFRM